MLGPCNSPLPKSPKPFQSLKPSLCIEKLKKHKASNVLKSAANDFTLQVESCSNSSTAMPRSGTVAVLSTSSDTAEHASKAFRLGKVAHLFALSSPVNIKSKHKLTVEKVVNKSTRKPVLQAGEEQNYRWRKLSRDTLGGRCFLARDMQKIQLSLLQSLMKGL